MSANSMTLVALVTSKVTTKIVYISEFNENSYRNSMIRNAGPQDVVISGVDFDTEIHDEDYRYERLLAGFMISDMNETQLPISFSDSSLEALIFPDYSL